MTEHQPSAGTDAALTALLGAAGLAGVLYAGAAGSAWLAGDRVPRARLLAGFAAFGHLGDPSVPGAARSVRRSSTGRSQRSRSLLPASSGTGVGGCGDRPADWPGLSTPRTSRGLLPGQR